MFSYDEERDILCISRRPVAKTKLEYEIPEMYVSYTNYIQTQLLQDIEEFVIQPLNAEAEKRLCSGQAFL